MKLDNVQQLQEDEYWFPYHHVVQFQNGFSQFYNDTWGINYASTIEFIISELGKESFNSLVDVGCGDGRLIKEIHKKFPEKSIEGVDYSQRAINLAKAMYPEGNYHCLDILKNRFTQKFDIATLIEVFEHIAPEAEDIFLEAVSRLLNPGGLLYLTVPHINEPLSSKHYRHFSIKTIIKCLEKSFIVQEVIPFEKKDIRRIIINRLLTNRFFVLNIGKSKIYDYYKKYLFFVDNENKCGRLFVKAKVK